MASLLRSLAPVKEVKREIKVDALTPTQIADAYMNSKINSVRTALLRGYDVPQEEKDLIDSLLDSTRSEAHRLFIAYYSRGEYLALNSLNSTYSLVGGENIVGPQPSTLSFLFYSSDGPREEDVVLEEGGEVILIGLTPVQHGTLTRIQGDADQANVKLVTRTAADMSLWVIDHPYAPKMRVYKQGQGLENVATNRGVDDVRYIDILLVPDAFGRAYGIDKGDIVIETRLSIDSAAIARRSVIVRYVDEPLT